MSGAALHEAGSESAAALSNAESIEKTKDVYGTYDWIVDYEDFKGLVSPSALGISENSRMLVVGCGTSTLSEELYNAGYKDMVNMDIDEAQIEHMREQHADKAMQWITADVTDMRKQFPEPECFDVALDKGTLDALLCTDQAAEMICELWRLLTVGGQMLIISFRPADFIASLLSPPLLPSSLSIKPIEARGKRVGSLFVVSKSCSLPSIPAAAVKAYVDERIQWWHQEGDPLLTPRREASLREKFSEQTTDANGRVGLSVCHCIMFGEEERGEYGYGIDMFMQDLSAWR
eukprot:CAMPEP_0181295384 /NCGR_PEP_ID=MMETSP1101-20121128/4120_1 /TAXON_ID=46948 /ORGANISM="Rhodomonas abbreviata, Strain Caron Lab Isolate" /LENGTH=289 /DNA_ID=CAMNT_0023400135 /DNA_START=155 /DNA_END=1021 /DNA_ORIENTATION=-